MLRLDARLRGARSGARAGARAAYQALGYRAQKWFFRHGPMSGKDGMRENVALVRTLRETLGEDADIMLDCWQSFDPIYAIELAERIADYQPRWLEECVMPDRIDSYRQIKEQADPAVRRRARIHALGVQAIHRRRGAGYPATRHLLVRRTERDTEDRGVCLGARPDGDPARALDAGGLHFSLAQSPLLTPIRSIW